MDDSVVRFTSQCDERGVPMQPIDDGRQLVQPAAGSAEPSHPWILGLVAVDDGTLVKPEVRPYSFRSECECPDDCLRDHGNE